MRDTRNRLLIIAGVLVVCCAASHAQTFYKWTDERGIVHLADEPPPDARGVEERHLPAPPVPPPAPPGEGDEAKAAPEDTSPKKRAQVILVSHQTTRNGPSAAHVTGEVKNVGGESATAVEVMISAVDVSQGNPCLSEQGAVNPSTLPPGESGNFDVDLDSPCLNGGPKIDIAPVWR